MTWKTALRLGRVSNLPTVATNVLAGIALSGGDPDAAHVVILIIALSLMYVAGMYLNDAFDRDIDRVERPERAIPSGQVRASTVFAIGFSLLATGVLAIGTLALATGRGGSAALAALLLATAIVVYDLHHKGNPWSPVIMGLCRAGVYATTALAVTRALPPPLVIGAGALVAYIVGVSYVAKNESRRTLARAWPLAMLALPLVVAWPSTWLAVALYALLAYWLVRSIARVRRGAMRDAVTGLIAGISLVDALFMACAGYDAFAMLAVGAWLVTRWFQRWIPGS